MKTCLIVIDAQESFRHRPFFTESDMPVYLAAQNALIQASVKNHIPIVQVFHAQGAADLNNVFSTASGLVCPITGLITYEPAVTFYKSRHSALVDTGLLVWLTQQGIQHVIVSGIRTEQCCETTTRHLSDLGWTVTFALDACLTFDMQNHDGSILKAIDINTRTATVLEGRFAQVLNARSIIERL